MADRSLLAHLFRRAAFGARPAELDYYGSRSYETAVSDLLSGSPLMGQDPSLDEAIAPINSPLQNLVGRAVPAALKDIQIAWLRRMVTTTVPLVERMTLFLHDHFATAYRPGDTVDSPELTAQNDVFRANALGNWRTICHAMLDDVALSCWLDNNINIKGHPNENLAREFMELFTLGTGNYNEADVREAARALTGMSLGFNLEATGPRNTMVFQPNLHDSGAKTILGRTGNFMPHDVVDILLAQRAAPRFLAQKLGEAFVGPDPSNAFVTAIADTLTTNNWELRPALSAILRSASFRDAVSRTALVKSPAEFIIGALRALNRTDFYDRSLVWMSRAGQDLYDPPTVAGWPRNDGWLGAGNVLARYNFGVQLAQTHVNAFVAPGTSAIRATTSVGWGEIFGITPLATATKTAMDGYRASAGTTVPAKNVDAAMITLIVGSPDFTLS